MAIELVTKHLKVKLEQHPLVRQYPNLYAMRSTSISRQMHTVIRDQYTERQDFVFYADRLIRLVVEAGLGFLPFGEKCVLTPEGYQYVVSIISSCFYPDSVDLATHTAAERITRSMHQLLRRSVATFEAELQSHISGRGSVNLVLIAAAFNSSSMQRVQPRRMHNRHDRSQRRTVTAAGC